MSLSKGRCTHKMSLYDLPLPLNVCFTFFSSSLKKWKRKLQQYLRLVAVAFIGLTYTRIKQNIVPRLDFWPTSDEAITTNVRGRNDWGDLGTSNVILWLHLVWELGDFHKGTGEGLMRVYHRITPFFSFAFLYGVVQQKYIFGSLVI